MEYKFAQSLFPLKVMRTGPLSEPMKTLLAALNSLAPGSAYNALLFNKYGPADYLSAHSDAEENLSSAGVLALSLGDSRVFKVTEKKTNKVVAQHQTGDGEIMWMAGDLFQKTLKHAVLKGSTGSGVRLSITAREHKK